MTIRNVTHLVFSFYYETPMIPQAKNPTNVGLDVVERLELFLQDLVFQATGKIITLK